MITHSSKSKRAHNEKILREILKEIKQQHDKERQQKIDALEKQILQLKR